MFKAGTKILMADGTEKNIEDVKIGDVIKSAEYEDSKVIGIKAEKYKGELYLVENKLLCTPQTHIILGEDEHFKYVIYDAFHTTKTYESYEGVVYALDTEAESFIAEGIKVKV